MTERKINKNLVHLIQSFKAGYEGDVLEGGSRSGKTWSSVDFIMFLCSKVERNATIHILRETYQSFKTSLFEDFQRRLPMYGIKNHPFGTVQNISQYNLLGNNLHFLSADKPTKALGSGCDYFFGNEALEISKAIFDQKEQRCRKFWWLDYNPFYTQHWIFDNVLKREDVAFCHSTMLDNPFISKKERKKILSYEGTKFNITQGTADKFLWEVYGLGIKAAMQGRIFKNVDYIDEFPNLAYTYGMDFGFTSDPNAIVKCAEDGDDLYYQLESYVPMETPEIIHEYALARKIDIHVPITADSADKYTGENKGTVEMVEGLKKLGWRIDKVSKTKSVMYWLLQMKQKRIHIVKNDFYGDAKNEAEKYHFQEVNGILINQPYDKFNHFWDAARYDFMGRRQLKGFNYQ